MRRSVGVCTRAAPVERRIQQCIALFFGAQVSSVMQTRGGPRKRLGQHCGAGHE